MSAARVLAVAVAAVLAASAAAGTARADGDPASDYLVGQQVFLPYDAKIPLAAQQSLLATVKAANRQGFKIRVALIWSDYDLGSVTALWKQPQHYARFLGIELSYYYKQRLLIVMPNGFGFNRPKASTAQERALLATIPITATPTGLAQAATTAVQRLAAAANVRLSPEQGAATGGGGGSATHDRIVIATAALGALALGWLLRLLVRRRAATRARGG
jgi:hypothetical protein